MKIINENAGEVYINSGKSPRVPYEHQIEAQKKLSEINMKDSFSTLLVLPTGAGKTFTTVNWLLKNAVDKQKKVLWIAHRHLLLEQASESFQTSAYSDVLINRSSFKFRVVSGKHDHLINLENNEDVLIASKDSLYRNLHLLDNWVEEDMYLIIDEAHHATAKTYREIKKYIEERAKRPKIIGLTATPFRTDDKEKGLLGEVFEDDIVYSIDLKSLINKSLLSRPIFEECDTDVLVGENLGLNALKSIERFDNIPQDIAEEIAKNSQRNAVIVNRYLEKRETYGKAIVFALNRLHAIALRELFSLKGIKSEFIISGTSTEFTGIDISNQLTESNIDKYKSGEIDVLINVNILTEGVDLPQTKTIFLARPTISKTLMTQMIGRGLRGEKSGGTKEAYIVSFIDDWNNSIAWVNPETIIDENEGFSESSTKERDKRIRYISLKKIEEFTRLLDESIDTIDLEGLPYMERVPIGMYNFSYLENEMDINCQVLIYNSTKPYYDKLLEDIEEIFNYLGIEGEYIEKGLLDKTINYIEETYFDRYMVPNHSREDIEDILKYYAQKGVQPNFYELDYIDRDDLNVFNIANNIVENDMGPRKQADYLNSIWNDDDSIIRIYFNKFTYFKNQVMTEIDKITGIWSAAEEISGPSTVHEPIDKEKVPLWLWDKYWPEDAKKLRDLIYNRNKLDNGDYTCVICGKRSDTRGTFHIDHIKPLSKGGHTNEKNLQILCRSCNLKKSDIFHE